MDSANEAGWGTVPKASLSERSPQETSSQEFPDSPYVPEGYRRSFSAEFSDGDPPITREGHPQFTTGFFRLNSENLNVCRRLGTNHELQLYVDRDFTFAGTPLGLDPFSIRNGVLTITAEPLSESHRELLRPLSDADTPDGPPPVLYSSGALSTETEGRPAGHGFTQLYGYWELRAKLPSGQGLWPAFWLVTETHDYWDEVDVFEVLGHQPDRIYHSTHFHDGGGTDEAGWEARTTTGIDTSDGFHVYGVEIRKDGRLRYTVDGTLTLEVRHTLEVPLYTMINLAVGGKWPGDPDEQTPFPAQFEIDYLRIYSPETD